MFHLLLPIIIFFFSLLPGSYDQQEMTVCKSVPMDGVYLSDITYLFSDHFPVYEDQFSDVWAFYVDAAGDPHAMFPTPQPCEDF